MAACKSWKHFRPRITPASLRYYLPLMINSMKKIKDIHWFCPVIWLIKEHDNLIEQETELLTPNQKW